jgi:hypothetical protein
MDIVTAIKMWMLFRPDKKFKEWRRRRRLEKLPPETASNVEKVLARDTTDDVFAISEAVGIEKEEQNVDMIWEVVKGGVRHGLTAGGGILVTQGLTTQSELEAAIGGVLAIVGFGFSAYRKWRRKAATGTAAG